MPPSPPVCACAGADAKHSKRSGTRDISRSPFLRAAFGKSLEKVARRMGYMFGGLQTTLVFGLEGALYVCRNTSVNRRTIPKCEVGASGNAHAGRDCPEERVGASVSK